MRTFVNPLTDYSPELELVAVPPGEMEGESERDVLDEDQEMELVVALLEAGDEKQLDRVLGDLIDKASRAIGNPMSPRVGRAFAGVLKTFARHVLSLGEPPPGEPASGRVGACIGRGLASIAGPALGLELEGLSREDAEFEAVRQLVRFAAKTVENAAETASDVASNSDSPADLAHRAAVAAARIYTPGLMIERRRVRRVSG